MRADDCSWPFATYCAAARTWSLMGAKRTKRLAALIYWQDDRADEGCAAGESFSASVDSLTPANWDSIAMFRGETQRPRTLAETRRGGTVSPDWRWADARGVRIVPPKSREILHRDGNEHRA